MPRKTKDNELKDESKVVASKKSTSTKKTAQKSATPKTKKDEKVATSKSTKTTPKKTASKTVAKKSTTTKKSTTSKTTATKSTATKKETSSKKSTSKTVAKSKPITKKRTTSKTADKTTTAKKDTSAKKPAEKKEATKKSSASKSTAKKTTTKKSSTTKTRSKKVATEKEITPSLPVLEYYDLPYRYNLTEVKVLAQNPHTLFVYWDISDNDRENFIKSYGDNFFNVTKPVLVIHNLTNNYTYEIDINDFANNWYVHVDDVKCTYSAELGRRPKGYVQNIKHDYLNVAYSNAIEIPNDHILYFKENDKIYFKNIKTNKITEKTFKNKLYANSINEIYKNYNISKNQDVMDMQNPSSDFLTSNVL